MRPRLLPLLVPVLLSACSPDDDKPETADTGPHVVPWSGDLPPLAGEIVGSGPYQPARAIVHFHSFWSHDACDGGEGAVDEDCLSTLRDGLCRTSVDAAFLSDHPPYGAYQPFIDLLLVRGADEPVDVAGDPVSLEEAVANRLDCGDGKRVLWLPGFEDDQMPLALDRHAAPAGEEADAIYSRDDAEGLAAVAAAGATRFIAHTEQRDAASLERLQADGLQGVEIFNLHAMLHPDIRQDALGLDPYDWVGDIAPFTAEDGTAEPDLMFAAFFQAQDPSLARWDELLARGRMAGVAGTDAHQNVLPMLLRDGERVDSYRRMMRWFSNVLLVDALTPEAVEEALGAGRSFAAMETFGTPDGFRFVYEDPSGTACEMGQTCAATGGTLTLDCPTLSPHSPRDGSAEPVVAATVLRDGAPWQEGCGTWTVEEAGVYRAVVTIEPWHLAAFLGEDPSPYLRAYPWIWGNAIRVTP